MGTEQGRKEDPAAVEAGVSLGSNLGDRAANLRKAVRLLAETPGVRLPGLPGAVADLLAALPERPAAARLPS